MDSKSKNKCEMITFSKLKSEYGFTDKLIKDFLGEPDEYADNPVIRKAAPMKLYKLSRVKKVMKSAKFKKAASEALVRKKSAKKSVETKTEKTLEYIKSKIENISVTKLDVSDEKLRSMTIKSYKDYHMHYDYTDMYLCPETASDSTIDRWTVNYIRHNLTKYDSTLFSMSGFVGKSKAYIMYKEAVLTEIYKVYPKYEDECKRQIERFKENDEFMEKMGSAMIS